MITSDSHSPSGQSGFGQQQSLALLATVAIVGQLFLCASAWLLPLVSEYSLVSDNISELVLGHYGVVQTLAFLVAGAGTLALAYAIRQLTEGSWGSIIGSLLIAIYGAGAILSAFFPTDQIDSPDDLWTQSTTGTVHSIIALISFLCVIVGMFVLTRTFAQSAPWRSLTWWSVLCAGGALALFIVQGEGPLVGLLQRAFVSLIALWQILVALRVRSLVSPAESPPAA